MIGGTISNNIHTYNVMNAFSVGNRMTVSENVPGSNEDSKTPSPKEETNPGKDFMEAKNITDNDNLKKPMNEVS